MAHGEVTSAIGDALLTTLEWAWPKVRSGADVLERLVQAAKPEPPMIMRTMDGEIVTGLVVLNRGQVLIFVGVREPSTYSTSAPQPPARPQPQRPMYPDDDLPSWARDMSIEPYGRHR